MRRFMQISTILLLVISLFSITAQTVYAASPVDGFNPGADGVVNAMVVQADGKILVAGDFTTLGGGARSKIGRLNVDGSLDDTFNPGADGAVYTLALQSDGKILVGGDFTTLGGVARSKIGRLNADGSLDDTFNPGANGIVYMLALQPDGKILVGGNFTTLGGGGRNNIGRLNTGGSLDTNFNPGTNGAVNTLALQADGKILVGGDFTTLGGGDRNNIGRLNTDGSLEAFNPGVNGAVNALAVQADGKILVGGDFATLGGGARSKIGRLSVDGSLDDTFNPGADSIIYTLALQPDGKILVGGDFTTLGGGARSKLGQLNASGSLDTTFSLDASAAVRSFALQSDGGILVGGNFSTLGGQPRSYIGRLSPGGSLDSTFTAGASSSVYALVVQPDGKIVIGGNFGVLGGAVRGKVGRLNADGSLDTSFINPLGTGVVYSLVRQPDGKIVVGGEFASLGGNPRSNIGRLNADGSLDTTFNPGVGGPVFALALQPDGKILVGGEFTSLGWDDVSSAPASRINIGRLNADGSLDTTFNPGANGYVDTFELEPDGDILVGGVFTTLGWDDAEPPSPASRKSIARLHPDGSLDMDFNPTAVGGGVRAMVVEPDGQIVLSGWFTTLGGISRSHIGRVNADGSLDTTFNPGASDVIRSLALQADGKIVVGGSFTTLGMEGDLPANRNHIGRLNPDGSPDANFNPVAGGIVDNDVVYSLAVLPDGKILVGGAFTTMGGLPRNRLARLSADTPALQSLVVDTEGTTITWMRSGSGPELQHVTFEISTNASTYNMLGAGIRVSGGWQLSGLNLPKGQNLYIRARGYYQTGLYSASNSVVEFVRNIYLLNTSSDIPQSGPIYTVNTTYDNDGICSRADCSLREAIDASNAHANGTAPDEIHFNIPAGCDSTTHVCTILPTSALPAITESVIINGFTQPGAINNTNVLIKLNGANTPADTDGLTIEASGCVVRGLMINQFTRNGVLINDSGSSGNMLQGNLISGNSGLGIDLEGDGVTHNDAGDGDTGPNHLQNFPVLTSLTGSTLSGSLSGVASNAYQVEFFASTMCDASGYGQGEVLLGTKDVTTNGEGNITFDYAFEPVIGKPYISATATNTVTKDTSEFSPCLPYHTTTSLTVSPETSVYGGNVTLTATVTTGVTENPYGVGQVQFKDGSTNLGGLVTLSDGKATYTTSALSVGSHSLKAEFVTNNSYLGSPSNAVTHNVGKATATVILDGLNQTYNGAAKAATATTVPAGLSVTFVYTLNDTLVTPVNAGSYAVVATINSPNYQGSASGNLTVSKANSNVALQLSVSKVNTGEPVTLTVTVSPAAPGGGVPTGLVTFKDGTTSLDTLSLADGKAQLTLTDLTEGAHNFGVSYAGDTNFYLNDSTGVPLLVSDFLIYLPIISNQRN